MCRPQDGLGVTSYWCLVGILHVIIAPALACPLRSEYERCSGWLSGLWVGNRRYESRCPVKASEKTPRNENGFSRGQRVPSNAQFG